MSATDLDALTQAYGAVEPAEADRLIAAHVADAIRSRRPDEAVRWQRVALRVRLRRRRLVTAACRA